LSLSSASVRSPRAYVVMAVMVVMHLGVLGIFFTGTSVAAVLVAFAMYVIRGLGITAGYHRLLAHRSFKVNRPVQFAFALAGSLAVEGGPLWWVAHHRSHHRDSDTDKDIHSPVSHGFWASHMGWMMTEAAFHENGANARDLHKFPELKFLQRHYITFVLAQMAGLFALGFTLNTLYPDLGTSGAQMLVWGFFVSTVFLWHITFMVNSVCHTWGARPYETGDASRNNPFIGVLGFGEGWHNNHHKFPFSARHGLRWWQVDATWVLLRVMQTLGLASDLKLPKNTSVAQ
jgi:stearoyl-CoA desaturase (delta-9 desaturase)